MNSKSSSQGCAAKSHMNNFPLKNYHRGLAKYQVDANQAGGLYSERVFGLGDNYETCTPGWELTWDEYGRVTGAAGVKTATYNGCNVGVHSSEYRMNVETATRPQINHYELDQSFDNLGIGRDIKDLEISQQISCAYPKPMKSFDVGYKGYKSVNKYRYN